MRLFRNRLAVDIPCCTGGKDGRGVPLGKMFAARSGDKGGNANLGHLGKNTGIVCVSAGFS
jgi:hypothetical protein